MTLRPGEMAPWFTAPTPSTPEFVFDSAGGRYVLMLFLPKEPERAGRALQALSANQRLFDDSKASAFVVLSDLSVTPGLKDMRGLRWFLDPQARVTQAFGGEPHWLLLDPTLRVILAAPPEEAPAVFARIAALPPPAEHAGVPLTAPVLIAPRIFEPELCAALIAAHQAHGGTFTGVMRDAGDHTAYVMDELKKRRDVLVRDPELQAAIRERLERRLFPLMRVALGFKVTQIERMLVSCYDVEDGGVFHAHRDNTTMATAHRRFACSLNLNDGFEGGDLRFMEYGPATYRPPLGGAVVFSCALMHEATPMKAGRRYAFLPFFYDDEGAAQLAAYQARTGQGRGDAA
jgi:predicted 2-oxoglutarate/Fe(II)-dependent dioxygenase YbiX